MNSTGTKNHEIHGSIMIINMIFWIHDDYMDVHESWMTNEFVYERHLLSFTIYSITIFTVDEWDVIL